MLKFPFFQGSLLVHGKATYLEVADDQRTIAVGTTDGRILLLSLVLDLSDPYIELIQTFPSRNPPPPPSLTGESNNGLLMEKDALLIQGNTPELARLSAKIRTEFKLAEKKQPSFRRLSQAVVNTMRTNRARSQACVIQ